ncbi:hypothetical protein PPERSA_01962 [Pseudocohnilembus persalinus]|uniref:Multi antimicrobial extrusion protein n=1 Tax=Pseudocohnilembus persalinus TaxID=266149 RepID=A0A0V0R3M5_PSEPJ|nr:hypothetical protein PPERSA_01962 [Pseudocohnilembus persalinus]|eukprot:KRX09075.1 hypothetical protein PPERSA_01962 [Pseudocohnilembus persalinus]
MIESHTPQQELESNNISIQNQPSHFGRQEDQQLDLPIFSDFKQKKRPLKKQSEQINLQNRKFSENVNNLQKKKKKFSENNINFKQDPIELQNKYQQTHEFHFFGVYNQLNLNKYTEMLYWQKKQQNQEKIRKNSNFPQLNNFQDQELKQQQQSKYEELHNQSYVSNFDQTSQSNLKEKIKDINSQQQQLQQIQNNISQQELDSQDDNSYFGISKEVFGASGQIIGCILIGYLVQTIILHHVGKLNDSLATNTVGMCISIISCLGGYFLIGVNQGIEIVSMASANQLDIMTFEFSSILIGTTKNMEQFAAHVSFLNLCSLLYSTPLGIGAAFNYIISNAIGKQDSQKVKRCYYLNLIFQVTNGLLNIVFCEIFMDQITAFYTSTVVIFIIAYYIIGLPIQIYLGLIQKFGVFGFWAGFDLAVITGSISILILSQTFHWEDQINNIYEQLEKQKNELADYSEFEDTEEL